MNPNERVVYREKPCVVLDAKIEGYPLPENLVLLQEEVFYSVRAEQVRHVARADDVDIDARATESTRPLVLCQPP